MHEISDDTLRSIINSIKQLDVRGFDSMNIVVGLVMFLEQIMNEPKNEDASNGEVS